MQTQGTIKEAKTAVSTLRRELKKCTKPLSELSHSDCLELLAKALGHKNWQHWEATLMTAPPATSSPTPTKYPLVNTGQFDFVAVGEPGAPYSDMLEELGGIAQLVNVYAPVFSARRTASGLEHETGGSDTEIDWDSTSIRKTPAKENLWCRTDFGTMPEAGVVLVPEDFDGNFKELPVRQALVAEYVGYLNSQPYSDLAGAIRAAVGVIGFGLTPAETKAVMAGMARPTGTQLTAAVVQSSPEMVAYRKVFNRVFTDEGDRHGTDELIALVMNVLGQGKENHQFANASAEQWLQNRIDNKIAINAPYDNMSVAQLFSRLKEMAKIEFEKALDLRR